MTTIESRNKVILPRELSLMEALPVLHAYQKQTAASLMRRGFLELGPGGTGYVITEKGRAAMTATCERPILGPESLPERVTRKPVPEEAGAPPHDFRILTEHVTEDGVELSRVDECPCGLQRKTAPGPSGLPRVSYRTSHFRPFLVERRLPVCTRIP